MKRFLLAALLTGCQTITTVSANPPASFATLAADKHDNQDVALRALSAAGVVFRVRTETARPQADLGFWREAMAKKLEGDGYLVTDKQDVSIAGHPGALFLSVAPVGPADYTFLVAFAPVGDRILIVESAGEQKEFEKVKPQVLAALGNVQAPKTPP